MLLASALVRGTGRQLCRRAFVDGTEKAGQAMSQEPRSESHATRRRDDPTWAAIPGLTIPESKRPATEEDDRVPLCVSSRAIEPGLARSRDNQAASRFVRFS